MADEDLFGEGKSPYMRQIADVALLTRQEEIELSAKIKLGDEVARERFIRANLRLVAKIARGFAPLRILPYEDLISIGNIGLMTAVDKFDSTKGAKFSTYAVWWIGQSIYRAMADQGREIRLPVYIVEKVLKMRKAEAAFCDDFGRVPSEEELAEKMGVGVNKINLWKASSQSTVSMDSPIGDDGDKTIGDIFIDHSCETASDTVEKRQEIDLMLDCLDKLPSREREIICRRYGLRGHEPQTLKEVGAVFKITQERIRQLQNIAEGQIRELKKKREKSTNVSIGVQRKRHATGRIGAPIKHGLYRKGIVLTQEQRGQLKLLKAMEYKRNKPRYIVVRKAYYQRNAEHFRQKTRRWIKENYDRYLKAHAIYRNRRRDYLRAEARKTAFELRDSYIREQLAKRTGRDGPSFSTQELEEHRIYMAQMRIERK